MRTGDTATLDFNWSVADPMPDFGTASVAAKSWSQNIAIPRFTVPAASGGNAPLRFTASGLPAGVAMSSSRRVSGTPGAATVTVTDADGDTDTLDFDWTVNEEPRALVRHRIGRRPGLDAAHLDRGVHGAGGHRGRRQR